MSMTIFRVSGSISWPDDANYVNLDGIAGGAGGQTRSGGGGGGGGGGRKAATAWKTAGDNTLTVVVPAQAEAGEDGGDVLIYQGATLVLRAKGGLATASGSNGGLGGLASGGIGIIGGDGGDGGKGQSNCGGGGGSNGYGDSSDGEDARDFLNPGRLGLGGAGSRGPTIGGGGNGGIFGFDGLDGQFPGGGGGGSGTGSGGGEDGEGVGGKGGRGEAILSWGIDRGHTRSLCCCGPCDLAPRDFPSRVKSFVDATGGLDPQYLTGGIFYPTTIDVTEGYDYSYDTDPCGGGDIVNTTAAGGIIETIEQVPDLYEALVNRMNDQWLELTDFEAGYTTIDGVASNFCHATYETPLAPSTIDDGKAPLAAGFLSVSDRWADLGPHPIPNEVSKTYRNAFGNIGEGTECACAHFYRWINWRNVWMSAKSELWIGRKLGPANYYYKVSFETLMYSSARGGEWYEADGIIEPTDDEWTLVSEHAGLTAGTGSWQGPYATAALAMAAAKAHVFTYSGGLSTEWAHPESGHWGFTYDSEDCVYCETGENGVILCGETAHYTYDPGTPIRHGYIETVDYGFTW